MLTRTRCSEALPGPSLWQATLQNVDGGGSRKVAARALVNAAGPWAGSFLNEALGHNERPKLRLIKGSHIVVPRLYQGDHAFILQNADRRIVFAIPYEQRFTLIGTTDVPYDGDPARVAIGADEVDYLCGVINAHFVRQIAPSGPATSP